MKIKEILVLASKHLGRSGIEEYLKTGTCDDEVSMKEDLDHLAVCYNAVMEGLSHKEPTCEVLLKENASEVLFSELKEGAVEVLSVTDKNGNAKEYEIKTDRIVLKKTGTVKVVYAFVDRFASLDGECPYGSMNRITPNAIALGIASEYLALRGSYAQAEVLLNRYVKAVNECLKPRGKRIIAGRMWQ